MNVPRLRFKDNDGREFPEWIEKTLEEIASVERGKFSVRPRNDPRFFGGNIPFVQTGDVVSSDLFLKKFSQTLNEEGLKVSKLFPKNTILITIAANIGDTTITNFEIACTDSIVAIQTFREQAAPVWLKYALDTKKEELDSKATQNAQKNINLQVLRPLIFVTPSFEEQTKIANFLTAIDEKITQLTQKCDLLAQYKKGVMQQIFSQKLRFKDDDGREFPEWKETTLGNVADKTVKWSFTGGPFGSNLKAEDYTEKGIRIIQLQNIGDGTFNDGYKIYTSENKANELLSCNIYPNEIIISKMGDPVARCCIMPSSHDRYLMASDGIRLVVNRSLFNTKYIHDFINFETFRKNALEASTGSTRRRIGLDELKKLPVVYPCLTEQTKIANFLTAIDDKITQAQAQLDAVKLYKKGLLQQMFV